MGCGGGKEAGPAASSNEEVCNLLTKMVAADSRIRRDDLASMRAQVPALAQTTAQFASSAPKAIRAEARVLNESTELWRSTIEKRDLVLAPDTLYLWATAETQEAAQTIRQWAVSNCSEPVDRDALKPGTLLVCLRATATSKDVQAVLARTSTPSKTGRGNALLEGITGVAARPRGVWVELDPFITPARKAQLVARLGVSPVEAVREGVDSCG